MGEGEEEKESKQEQELNKEPMGVQRTESIQAIHAALSESQTKKQNGFNIYKRGLGTYSGHNSGANTNGTATPNSIGALSR